jgi:hypothetical protein
VAKSLFPSRSLALGNLLAIIASEASAHPYEGSAKQKAAWDEIKRRFAIKWQIERHAEYLLSVIDAQDVGNTSEAWKGGVAALRAALKDAAPEGGALEGPGQPGLQDRAVV